MEAKASFVCNTLSDIMPHGNPFLPEDKLERFRCMSFDISMLNSNNVPLNVETFSSTSSQNYDKVWHATWPKYLISVRAN